MTIASEQNSAENIKIRRAISQTYYLAKWSLGIQLVLSVLLPISLSLVGIFFAPFRPFAAILSVVALALDAVWLDRGHRSLLKQGAKLLEQFDCNVLLMPWNRSIAGSPPTAAIVTDFDAAYRARGKTDDKLRDWYPIEAAKAEEHQARVICQLTNVQYDDRLRRRYRAAVMTFMIMVVIALGFLGAFIRMPVPDFVLTVVMPALPLLAWSIREFFRQLDTDRPLQDLYEDTMDLWLAIREGTTDAHASLQRSRSIQDALFVYRSRSPLPIPFVYDVFRPQLETKMNNSAADRLSEIGL